MANAIVLRSFSLIGMAYAQLNSARYVGGKSTLTRTGKAAKLSFPVHPHMLRHSTGYKLANDGHDTRALQHYMGHKISCTRFATPKWRLIGSRISGRTEPVPCKPIVRSGTAQLPAICWPRLLL